MKGRILIVEDEEMKRLALRLEGEKQGYFVREAEDGAEGLAALDEAPFDLVVTDLRMPRIDGMTILRRVSERSPDTAVIVMTAYGTVHGAVEAMKAGATDYLLKPFTAEELYLKVERIMAFRESLALNRALLAEMGETVTFHRMVGTSSAMRSVFGTIARVAPTTATVIVQGETGTGKELVADALHHFSDRSDRPLVKVSCGTLAQEVIESELFGHEKGAFTGAVRQHRGRFESAEGGTLYLDDIDDIPAGTQVKLLRALENREIERVGGEAAIPVDVRVVASTKVELQQMVRSGGFREDLFFRLSVIEIHVPPLRDRPEDIPLLARHFLGRFAKALDRPVRRLSPRAMEALVRYSWPGNVRELRNAMERAVTFARSETIVPGDLPERVARPAHASSAPVRVEIGERIRLDLPDTMRSVEADLIRWALERTGGNQTEAARILGIPRTTLRDRLERSSPSRGDGNPSPPDEQPSPS